jgi:hypothetical protein
VSIALDRIALPLLHQHHTAVCASCAAHILLCLTRHHALRLSCSHTAAAVVICRHLALRHTMALPCPLAHPPTHSPAHPLTTPCAFSTTSSRRAHHPMRLLNHFLKTRSPPHAPSQPLPQDASAYNISYWAFVAYAPTTHLFYAQRNYLTVMARTWGTPSATDVKFCLILDGNGLTMLAQGALKSTHFGSFATASWHSQHVDQCDPHGT